MEWQHKNGHKTIINTGTGKTNGQRYAEISSWSNSNQTRNSGMVSRKHTNNTLEVKRQIKPMYDHQAKTYTYIHDSRSILIPDREIIKINWGDTRWYYCYPTGEQYVRMKDPSRDESTKFRVNLKAFHVIQECHCSLPFLLCSKSHCEIGKGTQNQQ